MEECDRSTPTTGSRNDSRRTEKITAIDLIGDPAVLGQLDLVTLAG
jgi:hypothetical protein